MDKTKPPYNVSGFNQQEAINALLEPKKFEQRVDIILEQRNLLEKELYKLPFVKHIYPSDANFLLVKMSEASEIYKYLVSNKVIVRNRDTVIPGCIRITVGSPEENSRLIEVLQNY